MGYADLRGGGGGGVTMWLRIIGGHTSLRGVVTYSWRIDRAKSARRWASLRPALQYIQSSGIMTRIETSAWMYHRTRLSGSGRTSTRRAAAACRSMNASNIADFAKTSEGGHAISGSLDYSP